MKVMYPWIRENPFPGVNITMGKKSLKFVSKDLSDFVVMFVCVHACVYVCTCSGRSGGGVALGTHPLHPNYLFTCHFQPKNFQIIGWCNPSLGLAPLSGKSWIHHVCCYNTIAPPPQPSHVPDPSVTPGPT